MAEVGADVVHRAYYDEELRARADRPLTEGRRRRVEEFAARCRSEGVRSVVEVGCGAGRDGSVLAGAGLAYTGVDLSVAGVEVCQAAGLDARVAPATALPFAADSFDAGWTMSTLMHLDGDGLSLALGELGRVVRPGGIVEIGVWGATWTASGSTRAVVTSGTVPMTTCNVCSARSRRSRRSRRPTSACSVAAARTSITNGRGCASHD